MNAAAILANGINKAAKLYEESFDSEAAKAATQEHDKALASGNILQIGPDYKQFYRLTLEQACYQANSELSQPIFFLLYHSWNDATAWAEEQEA